MKCPKCTATFIRLPCPSCGFEGDKKEIVEMEEKMVRPSELRGGSAVNPKHIEEHKIEEEHLRKPSELLKEKQKVLQETQVSEPTDAQHDEEEERLLKPSQMLKKKEDETDESLRKPSQIDFGKNTIDSGHHLESSQIRTRTPLRSDQTIEQKPIHKDRPVEPVQTSSENGETLLRPSQLGGTSGRIISKEDHARLSTVKTGVGQLEKKIEKKNDENFKANVKDTLQEVISLLEKLIEE